MTYLNEIAKTALSLKAIYHCRKVPLLFSILFFLMINVGFSFPFVFSLLTLEKVTITSFVTPEAIEVVNQDSDADFMKELFLEGDQLKSKEEMGTKEVQLGAYKILFDLEDTLASEDVRDRYVARITSGYIELNYGLQLYADYHNFELKDLSQLTNDEVLDYILVNTLRGSIKQWYFPISTLFYGVFLSMNIFFVLGMSLIALIFRIGDQVKLTFRETLNVVIYATVLPTAISVIVTLFFDVLGLNLLIYNFGTFMMYMLMRRKYLKRPEKELASLRD